MISKVNRIKQKIKESNNPNEIHIYKTILEYYEQKVREYISGSLTESESKTLLNTINNKLEDLRSKIKIETNQLKLGRLRTFARTLEEYERIIKSGQKSPKKSHPSEYKDTLSMELAIELSSFKDLLFHIKDKDTFEYEPDRDTVSRIIELDSNPTYVKELSELYEKTSEYDEVSNSYVRRITIMDHLQEIQESKDLLELYNYLITRYFSSRKSLEEAHENRKKVQKEYSQLAHISHGPISKLVHKKRLDFLQGELKKLNKCIETRSSNIESIAKQLQIFSDDISNPDLKIVFKYNTNIVLSPNSTPCKSDPFNNDSLTISFKDAINSDNQNDILFFLGNNLHGITPEILEGIIDYLDKTIDLLESKLLGLENDINLLRASLSKDSQTLLETDPSLAKLLVNLNTLTNKYGIKPITYIYALDAIDVTDDLIAPDIDRAILFSEELLTWTPTVLSKSGKALELN